MLPLLENQMEARLGVSNKQIKVSYENDENFLVAIEMKITRTKDLF